MKRAIIVGSLVLCLGIALPAQGPPPGARGPRVNVGQRQNGQRHAGPHMGAWLREHQSQPLDQQQKDLQSDPNYQRLSPEQQQKVQDRLKHFDSLPPEQKQRILNRLDLMGHMTPEQRANVLHVFQDFRTLPPDRREAFRQAFRNLHGLSPEEQQKMIDSPTFQNQFSEHERDMLRTLAPLRVPAAEAPPSAPNEP